MVENGWASWSNKNLILTGINKLKTHETETTVLVPVSNNRKTQIAFLRKTLLHRNIRNQEKQIAIKSNLLNKAKASNIQLSKKELKRLNKLGGIKKLEKDILPLTTLSNKSIGKLFGRTLLNGKNFLSPTTGKRIQKQLRDLGLIKSKARLKLIQQIDPLQYLYETKWGCLAKGIYNEKEQKLYRRLSNEIVLTPMQK